MLSLRVRIAQPVWNFGEAYSSEQSQRLNGAVFHIAQKVWITRLGK